MRKTIRRDWLKKQIEKGNVEAKCNYHLTDDYAWDNAVNFGKTEWLPARVAPERQWEEITLQNGNTTHRLINSEEMYKEGFITFERHDFTYSTGWASWDDDEHTQISFCPLSGESYDLRIKS